MTMAEPVLKWAGGKRQLLHEIDKQLPAALKNGEIRRYWEPFFGGGAVFFHIKEHYGDLIEEYWISDFNWDLFILYRIIQSHVGALIKELKVLADEYLPLPPTQQGDKEGERISMFYRIRDEYNEEHWDEVRYRKDGKTLSTGFVKSWVRRAALTVFLNRTTFNGLYRVNSKGEFNSPHGRYDNPDIVQERNLRHVNKALKGVNIRVGSYSKWLKEMDDSTFAYFDPPYRPLSDSASFKDYHKAPFGDKEQRALAQHCRELDARGVKWMLSNSDPKNTDPTDEFFDELYSGFNINRVEANRNINSDGKKRKKITEILVRNYEVKGCLQKKLFSEY
jgi:DNA adenine methylase